MNEANNTPQHIVVTPTKSVGISLILTILFGPLGMLYSTVSGGIIMLILAVIIGFFTLGFGVAIVWPISIVWGAVAVSSSNQKIMNQASQQT